MLPGIETGALRPARRHGYPYDGLFRELSHITIM